MTPLYWKRSLSQRKLNKVSRDIISEKYVNSETWEVLDIYSEKERPKRLRRKYRTFNVFNRKMTSLYEKIWATYYGHLVILIQNMSTDNSIDFDILWVSEQTLKTIKRVFKENNIVKRGKLWKVMKYYVNPDISTYWDTYDINLLDLFK